MQIKDLPTPALIVDRQRLLRNIQAMQEKADANGVRLRPHIKTHKCVEIARMQQQAGAEGITVAKPSEAEVFVEAGFQDVRVAYAVVGRARHERLLRLMRKGARISFGVDTPEGARAAAAFYREHGVEAEVLVEVDVGHGRCGVPWNRADSVDFARWVATLPGLKLVGIFTHAGQSYWGPQTPEESPAEALKRVSAEERDRILAYASKLKQKNVAFSVKKWAISIGSTPSMRYFANVTRDGLRITEIRPGNYVFHDLTQVALGVVSLRDCALQVLTTVVSVHRDKADDGVRFFLDAGKKILTADKGYGVTGYGGIVEREEQEDRLMHDACIFALSEEHGWVRSREMSQVQVGQQLWVIPNHACVTVNTQDQLILVENTQVLDSWKVNARGHVW